MWINNNILKINFLKKKKLNEIYIYIEAELENRKKNVVISEIDSIQFKKNAFINQYDDEMAIKPSVELNSKENNNNTSEIGYNENHRRNTFNYQIIHFSNYSNTFKNATTRLLEPHLLTFSEFKLMDIHPQQQRLSLYVLKKQEIRLRNDGIIKPLTKDEMKIKKKLLTNNESKGILRQKKKKKKKK